MNLSIILWYNKNNINELKQTLNSIILQLDENELIIINDSQILNQYNEDFFKDIIFKKNITIINNSKAQGINFCWNLGIKYAKKEYLLFIRSGITLKPNTLKLLSNNPLIKAYSPDCIEYQISLPNKETDIILKQNTLFNLKTDKEVLAYLNPYIFSKIFKKEIIVKNDINFLRNNYYINLFIYKVLFNSKRFLTLDLNLLDVPHFSFDNNFFHLLTQWSHIFNYMRKISCYNLYSEEVRYAHIRFCYYIYFYIINNENNEFLFKKSVNLISYKLDNSLNKFYKNYYVINKNRKDKFIISYLNSKNLSDFIKKQNLKIN